MPRKPLKTVGATAASVAAVRESAPPKRRDGTTSNTSDRPRLLGTHVSEAAYRMVGVIAAKEGVNKNTALREAINDWLEKKGEERIA